MQYTVNIHKNGIVKTVMADEGTNLLELLRSNEVIMDTPCGGKGTCGKCAVRASGLQNAPAEMEKALLGAGKLEKGYRLSCKNIITSDMDIYPDGDIGMEASIITGGKKRDILLEPIVRKQYVELAVPTLADQLPDLERVMAASDKQLTEMDPTMIQEIAGVLKSSGYKVTLVSINGKLIAVEPGDSTHRLYGTAFDIGTTTVAAYLYDLNNGECTAVSSMLNPQRKFGADVIARISHTMQSKENKMEMQSLITGCINELTGQLVQKSGITHADIYAAVFTGNTTMLHFLMGLDAANMAVSPFIPVTTNLQYFSSKTLGLAINEHGVGVAFPGVSAYVGGDTVAAILSSGMYEEDEASLLIDIGTNGEIVLGGKEWLLACSTAAGPAFEGANIRNGVGGVTGAIDTVGSGPAFEYTTIGNASPVGICGSGIIDALARLLDAEVIDETGRLTDDDEAEQLGQPYNDRIITVDGVRAFILAFEGEKGSSAQIVITQKDIRELQNAKAAIAAGIDTLVKLSGKGYEAVKKVYLAGGFGSSINIESALKIGLLPRALGNRIEAIGNASGTGAAEGLLSQNMLKFSEKLKLKVKYVELSASADFVEKYVDNMLF